MPDDGTEMVIDSPAASNSDFVPGGLAAVHPKPFTHPGPALARLETYRLAVASIVIRF